MKWKSYAVALLLFSLAGLLAVIPQGAFAQQVTAALTGKVSDASGAAIPNARVIATDVDRGSQFPTVTNDDGIFNLPRVPIGTYNLRVEASGFQPAQQNNIILDLNQTVRADFPLQVGNVSSSVDVTSAAPLLQTDTTEISTILNAKTNEELPLATRNYVQLTLLAPGSTNPNPSSFENGQTTGSSGRPYINGNREQANNFILDGMDNNQVSDNLVGYAPSVDAIQEFNEITQNAPAEFGNFMGGIVSIHHQVRNQPISRRRLRVLPQRRPEREHLVEQLHRCAPTGCCAGMNSAAPLAALSSRTSCSSSPIIKASASIHPPATGAATVF